MAQQTRPKHWALLKNIAKGTTDPRVEVQLTEVTWLGHITSSNTNLDKTSIAESRLSINFKISTKHQHLDLT